MVKRENNEPSKLEDMIKPDKKTPREDSDLRKDKLKLIGGLIIYGVIGFGFYSLSNKIDSMIYSANNSTNVTNSNYKQNNSKKYKSDKDIIADLPFP